MEQKIALFLISYTKLSTAYFGYYPQEGYCDIMLIVYIPPLSLSPSGVLKVPKYTGYYLLSIFFT